MRTFRLRGLSRCILFCGIVSIANFARANHGIQIPLSQYQAGTDQTTPNSIQNPGFENVTSGVPSNWLQDGNMQVGAPINPPSDLSTGNFAAQALTNQLTATDPENYHYTIDGTNRAVLTFDQTAMYRISAYMWNFARPDPNPGSDTPDLAEVELDDVNNVNLPINIALARNGSDNGDAANGYFCYFDFPGTDFPNGAYLDARGDLDDSDPAPLNPPNNIYAQFDNIAITELPEPASLAFLGIAAVLGLRRRK